MTLEFNGEIKATGERQYQGQLTCLASGLDLVAKDFSATFRYEQDHKIDQNEIEQATRYALMEFQRLMDEHPQIGVAQFPPEDVSAAAIDETYTAAAFNFVSKVVLNAGAVQ